MPLKRAHAIILVCLHDNYIFYTIISSLSPLVAFVDASDEAQTSCSAVPSIPDRTARW